jgi:sucrose synthase
MVPCQQERRYFYKKSATLYCSRIQELFLRENHMVIMLRQAPARYAFYQLRRDGNNMTEITVARFLELKEQYLRHHTSPTPLTIDFAPFSEYMPSMREVKNVGNGIRYLNRFMCSNIFNRPEEWHRKLFEFIKIHNWKGTQLLINGGIINDYSDFPARLEKMCDTLEREEPGTSHNELEQMMRSNGFAPGWGNTAARILETMRMLLDLLNEPTPELFETFLSRVPMPLVARIAIISPHGWFGQENVLGKPDTGGQVIYILDQVRALEQHLRKELALTGLDIQPEIVVITRQIPDLKIPAATRPEKRFLRLKTAGFCVCRSATRTARWPENGFRVFASGPGLNGSPTTVQRCCKVNSAGAPT